MRYKELLFLSSKFPYLQLSLDGDTFWQNEELSNWFNFSFLVALNDPLGMQDPNRITAKVAVKGCFREVVADYVVGFFHCF